MAARRGDSSGDPARTEWTCHDLVPEVAGAAGARLRHRSRRPPGRSRTTTIRRRCALDLALVNRFVNQNSGRLPGESVVTARRITDLLREVIDTSEIRPLDVYAVISIKGILRDYLPTTLRASWPSTRPS